MKKLLIAAMLITTPVYAHHGTETTLTTIPIKQCMAKGRENGKHFKSYFEMDELLYNGIIAYLYRQGDYVYTITCIKGYGKPDTMREAKQSAKNREEDQQDSIQSILDAYK
jgi:hypothetical protein